MLILGLQGEGQLAEEISMMHILEDTRGKGACSVVPGRGSRHVLPLLSLLPCFSFLASLHFFFAHFFCPFFANTVFMTGSIQKFASSPILKAGSGESSILRIGWGLKKMSQLGWRSWTPWVQQDCFSFSLRMICHPDHKRAHCGAVTDSQGPEMGCPEGSLPCAVS